MLRGDEFSLFFLESTERDELTIIGLECHARSVDIVKQFHSEHSRMGKDGMRQMDHGQQP
jgi:hypothetical protein